MAQTTESQCDHPRRPLLAHASAAGALVYFECAQTVAVVGRLVTWTSSTLLQAPEGRVSRAEALEPSGRVNCLLQATVRRRVRRQSRIVRHFIVLSFFWVQWSK